MGALVLRKCESVANKEVSLFKTWATPVFATSPAASRPQLPVASAFCSPLVMMSLLKSSLGLMAVPLLMYLWMDFFASLMNWSNLS